ncbi:MAG TPA: hypothetical protein VGR47_16900 [Terracidiphilus sp.]|nr:hypothetical protein [Terracidiphilus sp.]
MPSTKPLLIQVVPRIRPGRCGITDHGIALAHELQTEFGVSTAFVALGGCDPGDLTFPVFESTAAKLLDTCSSLNNGRAGTVLVHLSGYGYSPDGIPDRLAKALEQLRASGQFRIAVYCHELFAVGPPWKSAFWYSHRQQKAVREIGTLCELIVTNTSHHANWLKRQLGKPSADSLKLLPVFSTVGEAHEPMPFDRRNQVMAVFGLPGTRRNAYAQLGALSEMLNSIGITQFLDIGPSSEVPGEINGITVARMGELSVADLARMLSSCMYGFVHHPSFCLAKSSIFAGYCAQGVIPVVAEPFRGEIDGLTDGMHVISPTTAATAKATGWAGCSKAAWNWYMAHSVRRHARQYVEWISEAA